MFNKENKFTSIRVKTITMMILLFLIVICTIGLAIGTIYKDQIKDIENRDVSQKVSMAIDAIEVYMTSLNASVADWGPWDDTYQFVDDGNEAFIMDNLQPISFLNLNIDMFVIVNNKGNYTYAKAFDNQSEALIPVPFELKSILERSDILYNTEPNTLKQGIIALPQGPMLMVSYPILTSTFMGPVRGQVVMGRYIDDEILAEISNRLNIEVSIEALTLEHAPEIIALNAKKIVGYKLVNDIFGKPAFQVGIETNRDYYTIGSNSIRTILLVLLISGFLFTIAILFFIEKNILKRLSNLSKDVLQLGLSGNNGKRLSIQKTSDEITLLSNEINKMLERIENSEKQIRESEALYRNFVENGTEVIYSLDKQGNFSYVSPNCFGIFGKMPDVFIGKAFCAFIIPEETENWMTYYDGVGLMTDDGIGYQYQAEIYDGSLQWFHTKLSRMEIENEGLAYKGILYNIHPLKIMEEALKNNNESLEANVQERTLELIQSNNLLQLEIAEREKIQEEITNLAYHDYLTGLPNKLLLTDRLNQAIPLARRLAKQVGVVFIDLDGFKMINDTMGHSLGDELLKEVSLRLIETVRKDDTVSRLGGDEFILVVQNLLDIEDAISISEKILACFKSPFILMGQQFQVNASIGVALYPTDGDDVESLIKNADLAMYEAKNNGKNQYVICTQSMKTKVVENMTLINSLYRAMERNELLVYYQPQLNGTTEQITGLEALLRWNHPELGFIPPSKFIPLAEQTGLILPIGNWVLKHACKQNKMWQEAGYAPVRIAVNLSLYQFQNQDLVGLVKAVLNETGLSPEFLELEITESVAMAEKSNVIEILNELKTLGITISIDDFGTEYSSLSRLKLMPIDRIKIDMAFVHGIGISDKDEAITKAIIVLAKNLGLKTIAEGVETQQQLTFLNYRMCDEIQGYYYHKPLPAAEIEVLLKRKESEN